MNESAPRDENPCRPRHFRPDPCGPAAPSEGPARQSLDQSHTRLLIAAALFCLAFLVIGARLVEVAVGGGDTRIVRQEPAHTVAARADIVDRNGVLLATTLETPSLFADPKQIGDAKAAAHALVAVLPDLDEKEIAQKLGSGRSFVWLKRHLTPREEAAVNRLGIARPAIPGRRGSASIPKGNLAAHVVGYADTDGNGLAGIERGLDAVLRKGGAPVRLSLDARVQYILRDETAKAVGDFNAVGGMGIVMDVRTGEVLAMVSLPDFDPNDSGSATPVTTFNRATLGAYEMGSVFKIFTMAMALDDRVATLDSSYDATNPIHIGRFTIHDDHAQRRWLTVPEIFEYSSNIGAAKMALDVGADRQRDFLGRLGLLREPQLRAEGDRHAARAGGLAPGQHHDDRLRPRHLGEPLAARDRCRRGRQWRHPPSRHAAEAYRRRGRPGSASFRTRPRSRCASSCASWSSTAPASSPMRRAISSAARPARPRRCPRQALCAARAALVLRRRFPGQRSPLSRARSASTSRTATSSPLGFATGGWIAAPAVQATIERMASIVGIQPVDEDLPEIRRSLMVDLALPPGAEICG